MLVGNGVRLPYRFQLFTKNHLVGNGSKLTYSFQLYIGNLILVRIWFQADLQIPALLWEPDFRLEMVPGCPHRFQIFTKNHLLGRKWF